MRIAFVAFVLAAATACGDANHVRIADEWPERAPRYAATHDRWTRHARIVNGLDYVADLYATLESAEYRAAYVEKRAKLALLPEADRAAMIEEQKKLAAETWQVEVLLATGRTEWNDLQKNAHSMWRISLVGDDGREALPTSIKPDRRTNEELEVYFRQKTPFYRAYVITFPKLAPDGKPLVEGNGTLKMKMGSGLGGVLLTWAP